MSFAVLLNNRLIAQYQREEKLRIEPWSMDNLQIAQYALNPWKVISEGSDGAEVTHDLEKSSYEFGPNEYAKVTVRQTVILTDGIVGRFIPASGLIEAGFGITAGKLDPGYGKEHERIEFGIKNLKNKANVFDLKSRPTSRVAYIEFFDISNLPSSPPELQAYDYYIRSKRRLTDEQINSILPDED